MIAILQCGNLPRAINYNDIGYHHQIYCLLGINLVHYLGSLLRCFSEWDVVSDENNSAALVDVVDASMLHLLCWLILHIAC